MATDGKRDFQVPHDRKRRSPNWVRLRTLVWGASICWLIVGGSDIMGQDPTPQASFIQPNARPDEETSLRSSLVTIDEALNQRGSITFRKTSLQEVVFLLSDLWRINIVAGEKVEGTVSGVFNDAPLRDVLSAILTSSGYGYTAAGNSLIVMPIEEVGTSSPEFRSRTLPLMIADDTQRSSTIDAAKMLLSDRGRIQSFGRDRVLVIDTPDRIDQVEQMFASIGASGRVSPMATSSSDSQGTIDTNVSALAGNGGVWAPLRIAYFTPQYTEASEMAVALTQALGNGQLAGAPADGGASAGGGSSPIEGPIVAVYKEENRIMVKGTPEELSLAAEAFQQLDLPRAQVRITTMIYDVGLKELEALGVDWSRNFRLNTVDGTPLSEFAGNVSEAVGFSTGGASGAASIGLRTLSDNFDARAFLNALDSTSEAKLLADPSITTADRREASIKIVQRIPVIAASPVQQSNVVFAQVEFEDAGIILKVTPRISNDDTIEMKVQPEYSVVTDFINDNPVIDSRTAETTVRVRNGHMFVLGGLRQKTINETVGGVPWLRDIKYVGKLFQNHTTEVRESELIVFLKPELICPTYHGTPREQIAYRVAGNQLDSIPYASCCPQSPKCCDPKCPNHHPRCRINEGSHGMQLIGDVGITPFELAYPNEQPQIFAEEGTIEPFELYVEPYDLAEPATIDRFENLPSELPYPAP
ncbi:secretin N-terminal domain-containing protein [Neorhodopirellula pilleata]|uniref:Type II secretion system protein D n=1 Tax=Neorhodopirellula pilleata TaxID=2714738 RepID=A0A5C6A2V7_9BACT|nr:secretin N-terminal domain-containing protein [Neorhodopirellula pilleata]TWT93588.1 Type II secretion system protein D precursor [Neorhodopirellula pilleata]